MQLRRSRSAQFSRGPSLNHRQTVADGSLFILLAHRSQNGAITYRGCSRVCTGCTHLRLRRKNSGRGSDSFLAHTFPFSRICNQSYEVSADIAHAIKDVTFVSFATSPPHPLRSLRARARARACYIETRFFYSDFIRRDRSINDITWNREGEGELSSPGGFGRIE